MAAFALVAGISLTSCLKSENNNTRTGGGIVIVNNLYGSAVFTTLDGKTITPSAASLAAAVAKGFDVSKYDGQIAQLMYTWDSSLLQINEATREVKGVTLQQFYPMNSRVEVVTKEGASNDSISDMPILSLRKEASGTTYEPYFWGKTLILPLEYYISNHFHSFTLEYHSDKQPTDGTLALVLEHSKGKDQTGGSNTSWNLANYGSLYVYFRAFDLTEIISVLRGGALPTKVAIEYREGPGSDLKNAETKTYTFDYKDASKK